MHSAGLLIDNFAGGGGASTGIGLGMGREVDIAINHDEAAIAVHSANHPTTRHYCQSIFSVDPHDATGGRPVLLCWFSPDCKHHSKAKGGKPRDKNIRDMAWVVPHWIERLQKSTPGGSGAPLVIMLENVEEFRQWGPLDDEGRPIKERQGEEFNLWIRRIKKLGYKVEHRELRACDYGAPTSRKRLFLIARRDGKPICWPAPTHGKPGTPDVISGKLLPWRTAAECIDWSIPCPSIFGRKRDLKPATCQRIAAGIMRYVVNSAKPFIVPMTHGGGADRVYGPDQPLPTVTAADRGEMAVVSPALVGVGGRRGQSPPVPMSLPHPTITAKADGAIAAASLIALRNHSAPAAPDGGPLPVVTAGGEHHAVAAATMVQTGYGEREGQAPRALDIAQPLGTVVATGKHAVVEATMVPHIMTMRNAGKPYTGADEPTHTITAGGAHQNLVAAFLHKYRPNSVGSPAGDPMPTVTANSFIKRAGGAPPMSLVAAHLEQANSGGVIGHDMREPVSTVTQSGSQQRLVETALIAADALPPDLMARAVQVAAFLIKYYGNEIDGHGLADPLGTVTTRDRFAVVTVVIDSITFVLVDIGMRMLTPRELANAQGFPPGYILDPECWYATDNGGRKFGRLPKSHQIAKIGNSVSPPMARALTRANFPASDIAREVVAA